MEDIPCRYCYRGKSARTVYESLGDAKVGKDFIKIFHTTNNMSIHLEGGN